MPTTSQTAVQVIRALTKRYTKKADMDMGIPADTLLGTLMSARTTDTQVLAAFPSFRKRFPTWKKLAQAPVSEIGKSINTIGLYRSKAKAIKGLAQMILTDFHGEVPKTIDELVTLPGVGRKTASCVLAYAYHIPAIAVDTHVFRITHRLGWTTGKTPEKVEQDLRRLVPERLWIDINHTMVQFGRDICTGGKKPKCWMCPVAKWCAYPNKTERPKEGGRRKEEMVSSSSTRISS